MQIDAENPGAATLSKADAEEYLESLESLTGEIDRAIGALVANELSAFEESIARQKAACARLALSPGSISAKAARTSGTGAGPMDAELLGRIDAAADTLLTLNRRYSALLKHSGDTMRLFAGLFQSYSGTMQQASVVGTNVRTWSCEL